MPSMLPITQLRKVSRDIMLEQVMLRRMVFTQGREALRAAETPDELGQALARHAFALEQLGLHDEAARLRAYSRALSLDFARLEAEAAELDTLLAALVKEDSPAPTEAVG